jgi:hypothetical protein
MTLNEGLPFGPHGGEMLRSMAPVGTLSKDREDFPWESEA